MFVNDIINERVEIEVDGQNLNLVLIIETSVILDINDEEYDPDRFNELIECARKKLSDSQGISSVKIINSS